jgi:hypothetical protein
MAKVLEVKIKKVMAMYFIGFSSAFLLPKKFFFNIMSMYHEKINDSIQIIEEEHHYKIN